MANIKISNLASASAVTGDDLFVIVNDPSGVPSTQKINAQGVLKFITGSNFNTLTVNVLTASNLNISNLFTASEMAVNNNLTVVGNVNSTGLTASNFLITTNGNILGNLTVGGTITAQEYHTEVVSASIIYQSGSTKFGNDPNDSHQFTGSLLITGSVSVKGGSIFGQVAQITSSITNYTLVDSDSGKFLTINSSSITNLVIPVGLPNGFTVSFCQVGTSKISIIANPGVVYYNRSGHAKTAGQYAVASIIGISADTYILLGDTSL